MGSLWRTSDNTSVLATCSNKWQTHRHTHRRWVGSKSVSQYACRPALCWQFLFRRWTHQNTGEAPPPATSARRCITARQATSTQRAESQQPLAQHGTAAALIPTRSSPEHQSEFALMPMLPIYIYSHRPSDIPHLCVCIFSAEVPNDQLPIEGASSQKGLPEAHSKGARSVSATMRT